MGLSGVVGDAAIHPRTPLAWLAVLPFSCVHKHRKHLPFLSVLESRECPVLSVSEYRWTGRLQMVWAD